MNKEKWSQLTLAQQLGNIGSEISRARHWQEHGDAQNREASVFRALELIDLTIEDSRWKNRLKEITRLREVFCNWYLNKSEYQITPRSLEEYCVNFSL